jgi:signal transduction histidine kinase
VYIIVVSAMGEDDDVRAGMLAGADDYLRKPLRLHKLALKLIAAERVTAVHRRLDRLNEHLHRTAVHEAHLNEELSKANQLQSDLIAMLSHDARQPLAAVIGFVETTLDLWQSTTDDVKRAHIGKALSAAGRLDRLIEDVLTMASLESGTIACRSEPIVVVDAVREVLSAGNAQPPVELAGGVAARATIDPWHLRQIMANLIGNATKYGAPPIAVSIHACDRSVQIRVRDHGEGVPPAFVPRLFDRFTRADSGVATRQRGTGLGLYIVKKLVEANAGQIDYSPAPDGTGACFVISLPRS